MTPSTSSPAASPPPRPLAFITGASEGLGRVFAGELAAAGYDTICVARNEARLMSLCEELEAIGGEHRYLVADLADPDGVGACVARLSERPVKLFVNNAGFSRFGPFHESDAATELKILDVNCRALLALAHAYLSAARPGDALINLSSITHFLPTPLQPTYCATKSFIASLSESLWYQQRARGVYVQGLCPGVTKTSFVERAGEVKQKKLLDLMSMTPERVVRVSLRALRRRRGPLIVPGVFNRLITWFVTLLPRRFLVLASGRVGDLA